MIYYILAGLLFAWLSWRWLLQVDPAHQDYADAPMGFTFLGLPALILLVMETSTVFILLLGLISLGLHLNYKHWRPFHSGIVASLATGAILLTAGVITGTTPPEWASSSADAATLFVATALAGCGTTRITTSTGYLPRYFAVLSGLYYERSQSSVSKFGYRRDDDSRYERFLHWMGFMDYTLTMNSPFDEKTSEREDTGNHSSPTDTTSNTDVTPADLRASTDDHPFRDAPETDQHDESQEDATPEWSVTPVDHSDAEEEDEGATTDENRATRVTHPPRKTMRRPSLSTNSRGKNRPKCALRISVDILKLRMHSANK